MVFLLRAEQLPWGILTAQIEEAGQTAQEKDMRYRERWVGTELTLP